MQRIELERAPVGGFGLRSVALAMHGLSQRDVQRRLVRAKLERAAQQRRGGGRVVAPQAQLAERGQGFGRLGFALQYLFVGRGRLVELAGDDQRARAGRPQHAQRSFVSMAELGDLDRVAHIAGVELGTRLAREIQLSGQQQTQGLLQAQPELALEGLARLAQQAEPAAHGAEIGMRDQVVGAQPHGLPVAFPRCLELALGVARGAEVVPGLGESRVQPQRAAIARDGFVQLAAVLQRVAQVAVIRGDAGVALERAPQSVLGGVERAAAQVNHAEDVKCFRLAFILFDQRLSRVELAEREVMPRAQNVFEHRRSIVSKAPPC